MGPNSYGELGVGHEKLDSGQTRSYVPVHVHELEHVTAVAAGGKYGTALTASGEMMAWGRNDAGQLGNGTTTTSFVPIPVPGLSSVAAIAVGGGLPQAKKPTGGSHTLALLDDGTLMAWGDNGDGELGTGSEVDSLVPVPVSELSGVTAISAGRYHNLALR